MISTTSDIPSIAKAMTVAGSDSGGGAGIQADLKTFAAFGVYGTSVLTAVTAQNTRGVFAIAEVPEEVVIAQIDVVLEDIGTDAAKTGMLSNPIIVENVADRLEAWGVSRLVVDPVMVAKGGARLLQPEAIAALTQVPSAARTGRDTEHPGGRSPRRALDPHRPGRPRSRPRDLRDRSHASSSSRAGIETGRPPTCLRWRATSSSSRRADRHPQHPRHRLHLLRRHRRATRHSGWTRSTRSPRPRST